MTASLDILAKIANRLLARRQISLYLLVTLVKRYSSRYVISAKSSRLSISLKIESRGYYFGGPRNWHIVMMYWMSRMGPIPIARILNCSPCPRLCGKPSIMQCCHSFSFRKLIKKRNSAQLLVANANQFACSFCRLKAI